MKLGCENWSAPFATANAMDIISRLFDWLFRSVDGLSASAFYFPIKATLLFLVPHTLCALYMQRRSPSVFSQLTLCVAGVLVVGALPVERISIANPMFKTWLWLGCVVALSFLPHLLATVLVPTVGSQRKLTLAFYALLGALFLLNVALPGGR